MMALLMVVSIFTVITPSVSATSESYIVVTKTAWDGGNWVSELYDVVKGDIVQFNITITYYNYDCLNNYAYNFSVEDYLPDGLAYESTVEPREPDEIVDNKLIWNFTEDEIKLFDGESFSVVFNAIAVEYGEQVNNVDVTAIDYCSGVSLSAEYSATVHVDPRLDVDKKVWDPDQEQWVDHLDSVIKAKDVRFQIEITYYGAPGILTCMEVYDEFRGECDCLEYLGNEEFFYPNNELFDDPEIIVAEENVTYTWRSDLGILFNLKDAESVIIQFDANVTDYCYCGEEYDTITNYVGVFGCNCANWSKSGYEGEDTATVSCRPHNPVFEKKVKYENFWVEETTARIGDLVTFGLELTYYGNYNLTDIVITDYLPKNILVYADDASLTIYHYYETGVCKYESFEGVVSEEGTVVEFTIPVALNDSDSLKITFNAEVINLTGECPECGKNIAEFTAKESETEHEYAGSDDAMVKTFEKLPINLCLSANRLNIGKINAFITNNGADDLSNVEWTLTVTGGLLKGINMYSEGTVDIPSGIVFSISTPARSIVRKFGRVEVNITAKVDGETFEKTMNGFAFGRIILIRSLIRR